MARPETDLGPDADARILARMAKGESPKKIHAALSVAGFPSVTERTIARRMAKLKPQLHASRAVRSRKAAPPVAPPSEPKPALILPASADEIPADASLQLLEEYRRVAKAAVSAASDEGDLKLLSQLINTAGGIEDRIQKRTPRPVDDQNDQPDMVKLGAEVEARFLKMVDLVLEDHTPTSARTT